MWKKRMPICNEWDRGLKHDLIAKASRLPCGL